ncbi:hypothetical protein KVD84_03815 [Helicobacter pylori]|nr:hypothetical protein KVD84_03815 [Helicobacter pylori]
MDSVKLDSMVFILKKIEIFNLCEFISKMSDDVYRKLFGNIWFASLIKFPRTHALKTARPPIVVKLVTASCIQSAYDFAIDSPQYQSILS